MCRYREKGDVYRFSISFLFFIPLPFWWKNQTFLPPLSRFCSSHSLRSFLSLLPMLFEFTPFPHRLLRDPGQSIPLFSFPLKKRASFLWLLIQFFLLNEPKHRKQNYAQFIYNISLLRNSLLQKSHVEVLCMNGDFLLEVFSSKKST